MKCKQPCPGFELFTMSISYDNHYTTSTFIYGEPYVDPDIFGNRTRLGVLFNGISTSVDYSMPKRLDWFGLQCEF